jgi:hypothetical protein
VAARPSPQWLFWPSAPACQLADRGPRPYKSQPWRPPPQSLTLIIPHRAAAALTLTSLLSIRSVVAALPFALSSPTLLQ